VLRDGRDLRVVARGLRNPFGLAVDPRTGRLYASVNERDKLGENEPAETIVEIRQGRQFGWPPAGRATA
jgi:glucose/arabinose dehydrogenase